MQPTIRLYDLDFSSLRSLLAEWGEPAYRARQLWEWLYVHLAADFDQMTNLPKPLRERLAAETTTGALPVVDTARSAGGKTRKDLLRLADGETVEAVLMRYERRRTACISTQVGCAVGCPFCATGQAGFRRDLTSGEIVAQALYFARQLQAERDRLTNVVLMGMGEPLLNYESSLAAIRRLMDDGGFNLGQRHITLSTVGIVPGIEQLAGEDLQITLAVSLHAATDALRDQLVPINRRYRLDALFEACYGYVERTGRRVSFEWALIEGVNDAPEQARALAARLVGLLAHVNLIPLNPTQGYSGSPSSNTTLDAFTAELDRFHVPYTLRVRRGAEIQAGCGQLRQRQAR
ncbi:MAG: 23S rRNA (adenine(2503)-C(2))-methyltransferase [Anaerolineaceae bacterium 4572_32.2]|nr:MAG: 23S rRNA (adenine(2503)-C(2))-methyltransferase [Anaerolineaceae bacterium 4572_32.2]HEY73596.1 23S rRNA (adenine(2503)-C(2))-methyltransferase RlmN [Thermoflexia bacterium]